MKTAITLICADHTTAVAEANVPMNGSVAELIRKAATSHDIDPSKVVRAVRVIDGKVFVDDKSQIQYLLGQTPIAPRGEHTQLVR
jgi:hypothetical protein